MTDKELKEALKYAKTTRDEYYKDILKLKNLILKNCDEKIVSEMFKILKPEFKDDE